MKNQNKLRRRRIYDSDMVVFAGSKVLLIGGADQQVFPMIRSFHNLKCRVSVISNSRLDIGYTSRFVDDKILGVCDEKRPEETLDTIRRTLEKERFTAVIPMNDFVAGILSDNKDEFSKGSYICVNNHEVFAKAIDKLETMRICDECGIPCPKTFLGDKALEFDDTGWQYPLVIKPRIGYGARGFNIVENRKQMETLINKVQRDFGDALIQEYIPQTGAQYQVEAFMQKGCCKAIVIMDKLRWYPLNGGSSTINVTIRDNEIEKSCIDLLKATGWVGYASLDLIRDPRDGVVKVMEINPRLNGTAKICFAAGVNLAEMFLEEATGKNVTERRDYKTGIFLRYFLKDILWFIKSPDRLKTKPSWFSWRNTVDEIVDLRDIVPFISYSIVSLRKLFSD